MTLKDLTKEIEVKGFVFLASVLGLKNECFYSDSEAVSPSLGLQPPPLMLSPPKTTQSHSTWTHIHIHTHTAHTLAYIPSAPTHPPTLR